MDDANPRLSECRLSITMPAHEFAALEAHCSALRRKTGQETPRAAVIRQAVKEYIEREAPK